MTAKRVTLACTYSGVGLAALAALLYFSPLHAAAAVAVGAFALRSDLTGSYRPGSRAVNAVAIGALAVAVLLPNAAGPIGRLLGASLALATVKLLGDKRPRDHVQIWVLSLLVLLGAALVTVEMSFALLFVLYVLIVVPSLVWLPFGERLGSEEVPGPLVVRLAKVNGIMLAATLPLLVFGFLALPRTAMPFWKVGVRPTAISGFGNEVALGDVGRIAQSDRIVLRAEMRRVPAERGPYWRGGVFEFTDGLTWKRRPWEAGRGLQAHSPPPDEGLVTATIFLEPHGDSTLFAVDYPLRVIRGLPEHFFGRAGLLSAVRPVTRRVRYTVESNMSAWAPFAAGEEELARNLALPADLPPVVVSTAAAVAGSTGNPYTKVRLLLEHFHSGRYTYQTSSPAGSGHPLERFLAGSRSGYCEYFASAMALMLRTQGVPARLVGGYAGGRYNTAGGYYVVRERQAHVWVEAYIAGQGWLRVDPTPPADSPAARSAGAAGDSPGTFGRISATLDNLRLQWYSLVVGYDADQQRSALSGVRIALASAGAWRPSLGGAVAAGALTLLGIGAAVAVVAVRRRSERDSVVGLYERLLARLANRGLTRDPAEGPLDFAGRASLAVPEHAAVIRTVSTAYAEAAYGDRRPAPERVRELREEVRRI